MDSAMIAGLDARYLASVMKVRFFPLTIASADGCRITDTDGVTRLDFQDNLLAQALQVRTDSLQRNDTPEARPRQVEQVCNHARHALSAVQNPRCDSCLALVTRCGMGQQRRAGRSGESRPA